VTCKSCAQVPTFENLMDSYCRSATVLKGRVRPINSTHVMVTKHTRLFKGDSNLKPSSRNQGPVLQLSSGSEPCSCPHFGGDGPPSPNYLIMAGTERQASRGPMHVSLLMPWQANDKGFKSAVRRFRKLNCQTLAREIRESMMATGRQRPFRRTVF